MLRWRPGNQGSQSLEAILFFAQSIAGHRDQIVTSDLLGPGYNFLQPPRAASSCTAGAIPPKLHFQLTLGFGLLKNLV